MIKKIQGGRQDVKGKFKLCPQNYCSSGLAFRSLRTTTTPRWRGKFLAVIAALQRRTDRHRVGASTHAGDRVRLQFIGSVGH